MTQDDWITHRSGAHVARNHRVLVAAIVSALAIAWRSPALAAPTSEPAVAELAREAHRVAGARWRVWHDQTTVTLTRDFVGEAPGSPGPGLGGAFGSRGTYTIRMTVQPYVDDAAQRKRMNLARKREASLWRAVSRLQCGEKSFADHYVDGLCFRTTREADERRVVAYRKARDVVLDVPRYHRGVEFAVAIRTKDGEPTDARCGSECDAVAGTIAGLFDPYPSS